MAQVRRGAIVDVVVNLAGTNFWNPMTYNRVYIQQLMDRLNVNGFKVLNLDDSNVAILSGGSMKVRVEITTDGYGSERDAASVVAGAAAFLGGNVQSFSGALVTQGGDGSNLQYNSRNDATKRDTTTGMWSLDELLPDEPFEQAVLAGGVLLFLVLLLRR